MTAGNKAPSYRVLWLLPMFLLAACGRSEQWVDEALLHDGRTIEVQRTVIFNFGSGDLSQALKRWPNQFALDAVNPRTGKRVRWSGEQNIHPILLDFVDGVPYLVVTSSAIYRHGALYGCPEVPYAFLKYDDRAARWVPVARSDAPKVLKQANLSRSYSTSWAEAGRKRQSREDIALVNRGAGRSSSGFFSAAIPESFQAWTYRGKERFANTRYHDDCRPPLAEPVDALGPRSPAPPSTAVTLEILETKTYDPAWTVPGPEWSRLTWSQQRAKQCAALLGPADKHNPRLDTYKSFIKNPSRVTHNIRPRICDADALWVLDSAAEPGRVVLIKANAAGDVLYRISFEKPAGADAYSGAIAQSTFRAEGGYLYFDWWNASQSGRDWQVRSNVKARVREPG